VRLIGSKIGVENFTPPENVYGIIANPVCSEFSVLRSFKGSRDLRKGMFLVKECLRIIWECQFKHIGDKEKSFLKFWAIENPATRMLRKFLGKPAFEYCPSEYGAKFTKRTALCGIFNNPPKEILISPIKSKNTILEKISGMEKRSECYDGFAKLFYYANP
jgi:hypothetical protein